MLLGLAAHLSLRLRKVRPQLFLCYLLQSALPLARPRTCSLFTLRDFSDTDKIYPVALKDIGVQMVKGDLNDVNSYKEYFKGVDAAYINADCE